ncbi:hypothetical protein SBI_00021 [Streptomyces bingchenggensis BCW-1]|uniref:Uncharacterized protein n=2 Tax=Streptomyces TaxID=1883 RepID=D7BSW5_STRBB|nr:MULTISPECIES: DUF4279 domain-containing protein [Streptomyces]ADI03142.1 hypothetical protein SBI_00021 [Streptomyces bingchenggensis BCW-1]
MSLRQYVYFALFSERTSAHEMTSQLGISPDEVSVRGSRFTKPTVNPVSHCWTIVCRRPHLRVDEQIARTLDRLRPHTSHIAEAAGRLAADGGGAVLQVVRYFNDTDQHASDAPNPFGRRLDRDALDFLTAVGAGKLVTRPAGDWPPMPACGPCTRTA